MPLLRTEPIVLLCVTGAAQVEGLSTRVRDLEKLRGSCSLLQICDE